MEKKKGGVEPGRMKPPRASTRPSEPVASSSSHAQPIDENSSLVANEMSDYMASVQRERRERDHAQFESRFHALYGQVERPNTISLDLVAKQCLLSRFKTRDSDFVAHQLLNLTHLRLDRLRITRIENLDLFSACTHLQLQVNEIAKIEGLEFLPNLRFLVLARNRIHRIENILFLDNLQYLDLSENQIATVDVVEFPTEKLAYVDLRGNPCAMDAALVAEYRVEMIQSLPCIREIDAVAVSRNERRDAGLDVSEEEEEEKEKEKEEEEEEEGDEEGEGDGELASQNTASEESDQRAKKLSELTDLEFIDSMRAQIDASVHEVSERMARRREELLARLREGRESVMAEFEKRVHVLEEQRKFLLSTASNRETASASASASATLPVPDGAS